LGNRDRARGVDGRQLAIKVSFYVYYQFRDDFIIKEQMDDSNPRKVAEVGDQIQISYLPRDVRISRIATWK
jgi:hypothetical protein